MDAAEERTASSHSGEAPNGANSTATATPPRWSLQEVGLGSIRNLGRNGERGVRGARQGRWGSLSTRGHGKEGPGSVRSSSAGRAAWH